MENQECRKCVMWLLCLSSLSWLKNPGDPNITDSSCPRLSTQVVFTAANLKTPLTCLSCLAFLLCVRVWTRVLWYLSALESSWKRESYLTRGNKARLWALSFLSFTVSLVSEFWGALVPCTRRTVRFEEDCYLWSMRGLRSGVGVESVVAVCRGVDVLHCLCFAFV